MEIYDLKNQIVESIANKLGIENLNSDYSVYYDVPLFSANDDNGVGLGLDSIDALEVIIAIKQDFGVKISDGDMGVLKSVSSIADFIKEKNQGV